MGWPRLPFFPLPLVLPEAAEAGGAFDDDEAADDSEGARGDLRVGGLAGRDVALDRGEAFHERSVMREAEPERQDDGRGGCTRSVDGFQRIAPGGAAERWHEAEDRLQQPGRAARERAALAAPQHAPTTPTRVVRKAGLRPLPPTRSGSDE